MSASFSAKAQYEGGITCTKEYSFPPLYLGYFTIGVNVWTCTNGCMYTTTVVSLLTEESIFAYDVEDCS